MARTNTSIQITQPLPSGAGRFTITAHADACMTAEDRAYIAELIAAMTRWLGITPITTSSEVED